MFSHDSRAKFKLTNPYIFWGLISIFFFLTLFLSQYFTSPSSSEEIKIKPSIVEQSYIEKPIVIDPDNLHHMDFENNLSTTKAKESFFGDVYTKFAENSTIYLLFFYTIILSILFIYREKQHRLKILYVEKREDERRIADAEISARNNIYEGIGQELEKHKGILEPELKIDGLEQRLNTDANYTIINARVVIEKIILKLYSKHFDDEATLNSMMMALYKKRILNPSMNNYAHTIKAFGNKALHPNINAPIVFESKEALFIIGSLLELIKELDSANLLKD